MKLKVEFRKLDDASINVSLTVVDAQDYPTECIFMSENEHPADGHFSLLAGHYSTIKQNAFSGADALAWAEAQKDALARKLKDWRDGYVPPDVEYII